MGGLNDMVGHPFDDMGGQQYDGINAGISELDGLNDTDDSYNLRRLRGGSTGIQPIGFDFDRYPKRQKKLRSSLTNFEFAPRSRIPSPVIVVPPVRSNRNAPSQEWSEHEKFVLLQVWGDKFLQLGRRSLRSEDWADVAEKVTESVKTERSVEQCRGTMDVLKRKYKKEKAKGGNSKWGHFRKMDMFFGEGSGSNSIEGTSGNNNAVSLGCGVDAGEFVFLDSHAYLERANGNDEMRDSPYGSEGEEEPEENGGNGDDGGIDDGVKGLKVLADSVMKFGEIYEKIEFIKREQMVELEKMRKDFQKELETQRKLILERAHEEIAKIREGEGEGDDYDDEEDPDVDDGGDSEDDGGHDDGFYSDGDEYRENMDE